LRRRASAAHRRLGLAVAGLDDVRAKVAALSAGWGRVAVGSEGSQGAGDARAKPAGLCDLPSDVTGRVLQRLGAVDLSRMRSVCRKSRAAVDLWEPELWRSLIVQQFIPEEWMSRLLNDSRHPASRQHLLLWSSWKRVYIGLHTKARLLPILERQAQILEARPKDNLHWRRKACTAEDVERKRLAVSKQKQTMQRSVSELEHRRVALSQMRKAAQAELSLYQSDGRWDPADIQIHVEAMGARQQQEERRCADKLRLREQLGKLQASASQGLQAILLKLAQVRCDSDEMAMALQHVPLRSRSIDAPTDAIGMIELQLLGILAVIERGDMGDGGSAGMAGGGGMLDGGRPQSPDSVGSDTSSDTSPTGMRRSRLAEIEEVQAPDSPPPPVRPAPESAEVEINLHLGDFPALGRMRPVQWAVELGATETLRWLIRAGAQAEFGDAWCHEREICTRLQTGERLLFGGALWRSRESPHAKLLRLLKGDESSPDMAASPSPPPILDEPPRAVGRWMGSPYNASGATARRAQILQLQSGDTDSDSDSDSDSDCRPIRLPIADVKGAASSDSSSSDDDNGNDDEEELPLPLSRSPSRKGNASHHVVPASPSVHAAAGDVQEMVREWLTQRGHNGQAASFHWLGSRRLGLPAGDGGQQNADVCVVIPVSDPDPVLLPSMLAKEADLPGSNTLSGFLGRNGVSSVATVPVAADGTGSRVPQLRMLRQVGQSHAAATPSLSLSLRFAVVPTTESVSAAVQAALVDGSERAMLRNPMHKVFHSAGPGWRGEDALPVLDALNEAAVAATLIARVPDRALYTRALAAVRCWAKAHGLYGVERGVGGVTWAILCAFVARRLPEASTVDAARAAAAAGRTARLAKLGQEDAQSGGSSGGGACEEEPELFKFLQLFFVTWNEWEWPEPVELLEKKRECTPEFAALDAHVWRHGQGGGLMPVLTPVYPSRSTTFGLRHDSFGRLCAAFGVASMEMNGASAAADEEGAPSWWAACVEESQRCAAA
jgi:hypothetical protein